MCQSLVMYYPKSDLMDCRSQPELYSYLNAYGVINATGEMLQDFDLPYNPNNLPM